MVTEVYFAIFRPAASREKNKAPGTQLLPSLLPLDNVKRQSIRAPLDTRKRAVFISSQMLRAIKLLFRYLPREYGKILDKPSNMK